MNSEIMLRLFYAIGSFALMLGAAQWLKHRGRLTDAHVPMLAGVITDFIVPLMIFRSLAKGTLALSEFKLPLCMILAELSCLIIAFACTRAFKMNREQSGAVMLTAAFGSSALLGYSIVSEVLSSSQLAIYDAVLTSELGVGVMIFTVGVMVAIRMGGNKGSWGTAVGEFLKSPVFISVVIGILWSLLGIGTEGPVLKFFFGFFELVNGALAVMVGLLIGLMLKPIPLKSAGSGSLIVCLTKLGIQPLIIVAFAKLMGIDQVGLEVLIILAAMPSAVLGAVFARRYGCDGAMASTMVLCSSVLSIVSIPLLFAFLS